MAAGVFRSSHPPRERSLWPRTVNKTTRQDNFSTEYTHPAGNHVVIQLETSTYLYISHLQKGSIVVNEGEQVAEGQLIGRCGNSGRTSEPHIHIHHQRQDPRTVPLGEAEGLSLYFRDHDGPPMPQGGVRLENGNLVALGDTVQHIGK